MKRILSTAVAFLMLSSGTFLFAETSKNGYYVDLWNSMPQEAKSGFVFGLQGTLSMFQPSLKDSDQSLAEQMRVLWASAECAGKYSAKQIASLIDAYIITHKDRADKSTLTLIAMEALQAACLPGRK